MNGGLVSAFPAWTDRANGRRVHRSAGAGRNDNATSANPPGTVAAAEWLAAVGRRWRGGRMPQLARHLAEIADPATGAVELDPAALRRLLNQTRLVTPGLWRLLGFLVEHGLLAQLTPP